MNELDDKPKMRVTSPGYLKLRRLYTSTRGERRETVGVSGWGEPFPITLPSPEVKVLTEAMYIPIFYTIKNPNPTLHSSLLKGVVTDS